MLKNIDWNLIAIAACWLFILVSCIGWIVNIYKLIHMSFDPITGMVVARVIGIFLAPLGSVLGFF